MDPTSKAILGTVVIVGGALALLALVRWIIRRNSAENRDEIDGPMKRPTADLQPQYAEASPTRTGPEFDVPDMTSGGTDTTDGGEDDAEEGGDDEPEDDGEPERTSAELVAAGDAEAAAGEWSNAVDSYDEALEKIRAEKGTISLDLIPVLVKRIDAQTVSDSSEWDEETKPTELWLALSISELHHGVFSDLNKPLLLALIAFYDRFGVPDKADSLIRRLEQLSAQATFVPTIGHQPSGQPWDELMTKGAEALAQLQYDTAIEQFDEAWNAAEPKLGAYARELAPLVLHCGLAYQARDNQTDEEDTIPTDYLTALGILERNVGPESVALQTVLTYIVSFYDQLGDHFRADRYVSRLQNALRQRA